jgi:hypothetical protein
MLKLSQYLYKIQSVDCFMKDVMAYRCFNLFVCWYTSMELFSRLRFNLTLRRIVLWWHFLRLYFRGSLYFQTGRHLGFPSHPLGGVAKCEALNKMLMCLKKNLPKITNTYDFDFRGIDQYRVERKEASMTNTDFHIVYFYVLEWTCFYYFFSNRIL